MKRCPECRRDYFDDTLIFCLDDGEHLLDGPRNDEPVTETLPLGVVSREAETKIMFRRDRPGRKWLVVGSIILLACLAVGGLYFLRTDRRPTNAEIELFPVSKPSPVLYWEMSEAEQHAFVNERATHVFKVIGDEPEQLNNEERGAIISEINNMAERKDSLSQKRFEEGLRVIYGRATQYVPMIAEAYQSRRVPPSLGIYQAMVESEYRDCEIGELGVGMFQFSRRTAAKYGLQAKDYCDVRKQAVAAASYMSDLKSDFTGESSSGLGLFAYFGGEDLVRNCLRDLHAKGETKRSFWAILSHQSLLREPLTNNEKRYVPRFFAVAIIGETPEAFGLSTPALTAVTNIRTE